MRNTTSAQSLLLQALDQRRPSHRSPAHRSYSPSLSSVHKRKVLPPPPGPPPLPHDTLDIPSPESPANGPFTPVSGQAHRQPFTGAAPDHSPGPPSPPSPSNVGVGYELRLLLLSLMLLVEENLSVQNTCIHNLYPGVSQCAVLCCAALCRTVLTSQMLCST